MTTSPVETLARLSLKVYEKPIESAVLPLIFKPDERGDTQSLHTKITSVYATAGRAIAEKRRLKLIVGTPVSKDDTKPDSDLVCIDDTLMHQAHIFSLKRVRHSDLLTPGVYATWHGNNFFISDIIERALSQHYSVILVERERVQKLHLKHRSERVHPRRKAKPIPLITPGGFDLGALSLDDFLKKIDHLNGKQPSRIVLAFLEITAPEIARIEGISAQTIRYSIRCALRRIDPPPKKSIVAQKNNYRYQGRLLVDMDPEELDTACRQLHISGIRRTLLELRVGITTGTPASFKEIAEAVDLTTKQVGNRLRTIRELCQNSS